MQVTDLFENRPGEVARALSGVCDGIRHDVRVVLNEEHTLSLFCEKTLLHTFVCSPSDLGLLCAGWLLGEGYTATSVEVSQDGRTAFAKGVSCSPTPAEKYESRQVAASADEMLELFQTASDKHARSHGVHECVIKGSGWQIVQTDIGRHNAIDKAVGNAAVAGYDLRGAVMFSSGRINVQTVKKAARCKIGCLMSKAVITDDALILARELGLKILFSVKGNSYISV